MREACPEIHGETDIKRAPSVREPSDYQKTYGWHRRARKPFDFTSKIGDMYGDLRAILLAQSLAGQGDYADLVINTGIEIGAEYYAIGFKKGSGLTAKVNVILEALGKVGYTTELATKYGLETSLLIKG